MVDLRYQDFRLDGDVHRLELKAPGARDSILGGLDDILTVNRLGLPADAAYAAMVDVLLRWYDVREKCFRDGSDKNC